MFCELSKADIDFPVNFDLKIIVTSAKESEEHRKELESVLSDLDIPCSNWRERVSSKGSYLSYTVNVTVMSRELFDRMYLTFREKDYIKTVI